MDRRRFLLPWVVVVSIAGGVAAAAPQNDPFVVKIGKRKQLFVDDHIVSERWMVTRQYGVAEKAREDGKPMFPDNWGPVTVLYEDGKFRMWYFPKEEGHQFGLDMEYVGGYATAYAESLDGLKWKKISDTKGVTSIGIVLHDLRERDPAFRYKSVVSLPMEKGGKFLKPALAYSADGISWKLHHEGKPISYKAADFPNQILWDEDARTYRLIVRSAWGDDQLVRIWRGVRTMVNPDPKGNPAGWVTVRSWTLDREGLEEDKRRQMYNFNDWIYEGVHFGIITLYEHPGDLSEGPYDTAKRHERDVQNSYVVTSRDGASWDETTIYAQRPVIRRGAAGTFDKDNVYLCPTIVTVQDKHWLYYAGGRERHDIAAHESYWTNQQSKEVYVKRIREAFNGGLAYLRLDGFVFLEAGAAEGTVTTKPFLFEGTRLEVNADASKGRVIVEVLTPEQTGIPLSGFTAGDAKSLRDADDLHWHPQWTANKDCSALKGKVVRLKFHCKNARLYAFQVQ